jgi:Bacterial CdiA-CT RNAse A domain
MELLSLRRAEPVNVANYQPKTRGAVSISLLAVCIAIVFELAACGRTTSPIASSKTPEEATHSADSAAARERYDLARDEARGGHVLERHVGRTDQELRERLQNEPNISAASAWTDRDTAEITIAEALRAERGRVERWMRRGYPRANLALHYDAGRTVGRSVRRGETQPVDCSNAVIVLRAEGFDSYYVLTAYPEARE